MEDNANRGCDQPHQVASHSSITHTYRPFLQSQILHTSEQTNRETQHIQFTARIVLQSSKSKVHKDHNT
uniref:Uncharacterized protein n=1 Tax=Solanum tuberosum TaxID=4113 RepID=M1B5G3_SOLTU